MQTIKYRDMTCVYQSQHLNVSFESNEMALDLQANTGIPT